MRKIKPKSESDFTGPLRPKGKKAKIYPTFRIDLDHLPEAEDWKVGDMYEIKMRVKQIGISKSRFQNEAEFEIRGIETADAEKDEDEKKEDEEEEGGSEEAKGDEKEKEY